jgi:hypothetical protein
MNWTHTATIVSGHPSVCLLVSTREPLDGYRWNVIGTSVRLSALRAGCPLLPGRFLVLISDRGWVDPRVIVRLEALGKLNKIHLIRTRTRVLLACSIVPQPTTLQLCKWIHFWVCTAHTGCALLWLSSGIRFRCGQNWLDYLTGFLSVSE